MIWEMLLADSKTYIKIYENWNSQGSLKEEKQNWRVYTTTHQDLLLRYRYEVLHRHKNRIVQWVSTKALGTDPHTGYTARVPAQLIHLRDSKRIIRSVAQSSPTLL